LIALIAGRRFNARPPAATAGVAPTAGDLDPRRAPDISTMTPRDRADRLYDHVMRTQNEGKLDSMQFFARMAVDAYGSLPERDLDARYDLGRIAEAAGALPVAAAQADSILGRAPTHLLGLILAASVAERSGNDERAREMRQRLLQSAESERRKSLPEYQRHEREIEGALAAARASTR
jgi:hypothetical protein